jgi:hypothetical protein
MRTGDHQKGACYVSDHNLFPEGENEKIQLINPLMSSTYKNHMRSVRLAGSFSADKAMDGIKNTTARTAKRDRD